MYGKYLVLIFSIFLFYGCIGSSNENTNQVLLENNNEVLQDIQTNGDLQIGTQVGYLAPEFSLTDVEGNTKSLSELKGKPVVISFFASWCTPCLIESNIIKKIDDESGGNKFEVIQIGIDNRESINDLKNFKTNYGNDDWIVSLSPEIAEIYSVQFLDTTVIMDPQGKIIFRDNGTPLNENELRNLIAQYS